MPDSATVQDHTSTPTPDGVPPFATLADRVRHAAAARPDQPALIWQGRSITWAELDDSIDQAADGLSDAVRPASAGLSDRVCPASAGLSDMVPSDFTGHPPRIAIALTNTPDFVVAYLATLRSGLVAVPVDPASSARELRHVLADSAAALLIGTERVRDLAAGLVGELPALRAVTDAAPTGPGRQPTRDSRPGSDDLAVLLYTSGTEGRPKGAMLSHRALLANHEQISQIEPAVVGPDDVVLLALPLFHVYGLNTGLGSVIYQGACGVLVDRFDPDATLEIVTGRRVSVLVGVPTMYLEWSTRPELEAAMGTVRTAVCGAAPLDPAVGERFVAASHRPLHVGYGLTETAPVLTSTLASGTTKPGSIGAPLPGVEVRLVGATGELLWQGDGTTGSVEEDDGDDLDFDLSSPGTDPGEIVVRGANLFSGYWPDGRDGPDSAGWWATGDVAYADPDGDLFLVDRLGELILVHGFNVYPREVELVLDAHPEVVESAVLGHPHPHSGQAVTAYVVRVPAGTVTDQELRAHCARNLARFKCPSVVEFVEELPHSLLGRVRKTLLRPVSERGAGGDVTDG
ncbi:long-chain acyl-CoA synthetase [Micromonospora polyrhachis]|uniref:Long-chain acyl-CoA synthetase n=1 Tax=Micromonospora polyrhachis TaxID=1282883 RepID=A0A7W7SRP9_9ACTN|nr:long-chain acyl-CoA synthetase [Micromonospora polyrhachis]